MIEKRILRYRIIIQGMVTNLITSPMSLKACGIAIVVFFKVVQYRTELTNTDSRPPYTAPYQAKPKARELEKEG